MSQMKKIKLPITERAFFQWIMFIIFTIVLFIVAFALQPQTYGWF